jgi:hypothetical protein
MTGPTARDELRHALDVLGTDAVDQHRDAMWRYGVRHALTIIDLALAAARSEAPGELDAETLGFDDLLRIGSAILTKYPPDTIVCSHDERADIGARTVAAIADLIESCREARS